MKKEVLIFARTSKLGHVGGPYGYLNNLRNQIKKAGVTNIHFIEDGEHKVAKKKKLKRIRSILYPFKRAIYFHRLLSKGKRSEIIDNCKEDMIHFHFTEDMYKYRDSLKSYKGKIILTSHAPTLASSQIIDSLSKFEKIIFKKIYCNLIKMDMYAFERADYIIFPCEQAEEPYSHAWDEYDTFKRENKYKYRYLPTGIDKCEARCNKAAIRKKYHISNEDFVVSFVGRHNEIKGYDKLKIIGNNLLKHNTDIDFLIAGAEGPLKQIENKRWIEVGWTNDPYSLINASDVFVLPNKETYFDLVFLEVLSLGKTIVASNTGGNKYFSQFKNSGIYLYNSTTECQQILEKLKRRTNSKVEQDEKANLKIYIDNFTSEKFLKNYIKIINSLEA